MQWSTGTGDWVPVGVGIRVYIRIQRGMFQVLIITICRWCSAAEVCQCALSKAKLSCMWSWKVAAHCGCRWLGCNPEQEKSCHWRRIAQQVGFQHDVTLVQSPEPVQLEGGHGAMVEGWSPSSPSCNDVWSVGGSIVWLHRAQEVAGAQG